MEPVRPGIMNLPGNEEFFALLREEQGIGKILSSLAVVRAVEDEPDVGERDAFLRHVGVFVVLERHRQTHPGPGLHFRRPVMGGVTECAEVKVKRSLFPGAHIDFQ